MDEIIDGMSEVSCDVLVIGGGTAGPMAALKKTFEAKNAGVTLKFTPGTSKALAERILTGEGCDVFAPSSPAVIDEDLMGKKATGASQEAASWYVVFSANEMAVITAKGNPLAIRQVSDLAKPGVQVVIPNPKTAGNGRYTYLAAWGYKKQNGATDAQAYPGQLPSLRRTASAPDRRDNSRPP